MRACCGTEQSQASIWPPCSHGLAQWVTLLLTLDEDRQVERQKIAHTGGQKVIFSMVWSAARPALPHLSIAAG